jgi:hypothetical protein
MGSVDMVNGTSRALAVARLRHMFQTDASALPAKVSRNRGG